MQREYYYIVVDGGDGEAATWFFPDKNTWLLWFELNEASEYQEHVLDDGRFVVHGTMDDSALTTEDEVRERFAEEDEFDV